MNRALTGFTSTIFAEMSALALATDSVNLGQGFPDFDGPQSVLDRARRAIAEGVNQYPPGPGIPALRQAGDADWAAGALSNRSVLHIARRAFAAAEAEFRAVEIGRAGRLHVAMECHHCFDWLLPVLDQFRRAWPEVDLDIRQSLALKALPELVRGQVSAMCGDAAFRYVEKVIELAMDGQVDATVTNAFNKEAVNLAGHHYSGHTEIYADPLTDLPAPKLSLYFQHPYIQILNTAC